jgi:hypothetical protein
MNIAHIYHAAIALGHQEPISVEPDGTIWTGKETERYDLTETENAAVHAKAAQFVEQLAAQKQAVLDKLGLTQDEANLILG